MDKTVRNRITHTMYMYIKEGTIPDYDLHHYMEYYGEILVTISTANRFIRGNLMGQFNMHNKPSPRQKRVMRLKALARRPRDYEHYMVRVIIDCEVWFALNGGAGDG